MPQCTSLSNIYTVVMHLKLKLQGLWFNKQLLKELYSNFIAHNLEKHLFFQL